MCLLLGNDFLPHFPSLNIRTTGIHTIMATYKNTLGKRNLNLCSKNKIYWCNLKILIDALSDNEHNNLKDEYKLRNRFEKRHYSSNTVEEKTKKIGKHTYKKERNRKVY